MTLHTCRLPGDEGASSADQTKDEPRMDGGAGVTDGRKARHTSRKKDGFVRDFIPYGDQKE